MVVCHFVLFLLTIVLSALFRFTDSDYTFGIFKLVLLIVNLLLQPILEQKLFGWRLILQMVHWKKSATTTNIDRTNKMTRD